jgi:predicted transcriptional regulator
MSLSSTRSIKNFGKVSNAVVQNPDISLKDKGLYAYLCTKVDNDTGETHVSIYKMASECGSTPATIKRSLRNLQKLGVITRVQGNVGSNTKTIIVR